MELNQKLIIDIELMSNAATVHRINEATCNYGAFVKMVNGKAYWVKKEKFIPENIERWERKAKEWESYIAFFVQNGKFPDKKPQVII